MDCEAFAGIARHSDAPLTFPPLGDHFPARGKNVRKFIINHLTVRGLKQIIRHFRKKLTSFQTLISGVVNIHEFVHFLPGEIILNKK